MVEHVDTRIPRAIFPIHKIFTPEEALKLLREGKHGSDTEYAAIARTKDGFILFYREPGGKWTQHKKPIGKTYQEALYKLDTDKRLQKQFESLLGIQRGRGRRRTRRRRRRQRHGRSRRRRLTRKNRVK